MLSCSLSAARPRVERRWRRSGATGRAAQAAGAAGRRLRLGAGKGAPRSIARGEVAALRAEPQRGSENAGGGRLATNARLVHLPEPTQARQRCRPPPPPMAWRAGYGRHRRGGSCGGFRLGSMSRLHFICTSPSLSGAALCTPSMPAAGSGAGRPRPTTYLAQPSHPLGPLPAQAVHSRLGRGCGAL